MKKLIITADDFGYSKLFNKMILELVEERSVKSTSVMVDKIDSNQKEQVESLIKLSQNNFVSTGLHIYFKNTNFSEEIERQWKKFIKIFWFQPSHIDIHKLDYLDKGYPIIQEFSKRKKIPCKNLSKYNENIMDFDLVITTQTPDFSGTGKNFDEISIWLDNLKNWISIITFHPWHYDPESLSGLNKEREKDAENIRKIIANLNHYNIKLVNFYDLK